MEWKAMGKLDNLEARTLRVMRAGGDWRPWDFFIKNRPDGTIFIICEFWNGRAGSASREELERNGRERYLRLPENVHSIQEALALIERFKETWARQHGLKRAPDAQILDCRQAYSDAARRAVWEAQGGTVLEALADQRGERLIDILSEYGAQLEDWRDVCRWRGELLEGLTGEAPEVGHESNHP